CAYLTFLRSVGQDRSIFGETKCWATGMSELLTGDGWPVFVALCLNYAVFSIVSFALITQIRIDGIWGNHIDPIAETTPPTLQGLINEMRDWCEKRSATRLLRGVEREEKDADALAANNIRG